MIAVIVPTLNRSRKLPRFISQFQKNSTQAKLYFVVSAPDTQTIKVLKKLKQKYFLIDPKRTIEYVEAVNYGFAHTIEPFVLFGADDIVFTPGWDTILLKETANQTKHIFGSIDSWNISRTLKHLSHPMLRRSYFKSFVHNPVYTHYMADIELVQKGLREDIVKILPKILIEHPHPLNDRNPQGKMDATYKISNKVLQQDISWYNRRKPLFEMYDFDALYQGYGIPTKNNPQYHQVLVSIVIPSYNDIDYLKGCLESVASNTYYRYEIIIINDHSDAKQYPCAWEEINTKKFLDAIELEDKSCIVRVIHNTRQKWVNGNWNLGVKEARGNYIALINSDITVSKDWDAYLVATLENPLRKFTISCPYETTPLIAKPFSLHPFHLKHQPNMIKGSCFMIRRNDVSRLFPIPINIKHWCGDNVLADRAQKMQGVVFAKKAIIHHFTSKSSAMVKESVLNRRIRLDIINYERFSGKDMSHLKSLNDR